jgi:hypothetical protein
MPTRLGTEGKEKQWGVWLRVVTTRQNIGLNQWSGGEGGYSTYNGEAAEDISQSDFQSKFRFFENNGKNKQHNPSNVECGSLTLCPIFGGTTRWGVTMWHIRWAMLNGTWQCRGKTRGVKMSHD